MRRATMFMNQRFNTKMSILSKSIYTFNAIPIKVTAGFLVKELTLKYIRKILRTQNVKTILKMKNKVKEVTLLDSRLSIKLQSSRQDSGGLRTDSHTQINGTNRKSTNKPTLLWSTDSSLTYQGKPMGERGLSSKHCQNNWIPVQK